MAQVSKATRIMDRARPRILASLARAKRSFADIPLGEKKLDPRTVKKREEAAKLEPGLDTTLTRILHELRSKQQ
jgi:hypothetical protein